MIGRGMARLLAPILAAAAALAPPAQDALVADVQAALDRARPALRKHLAQARGGPLALVCLAALHDEFAHDDPALSAAIRRLRGTNLATTYELALRLMAMEAMPEYPRRKLAAADDLEALLGNLGGVGFSYTDRTDRPDLSNTQYGALGLRAAASIGCDVPSKAWRILARGVARVQLRDGGFTYGMGGASSGAYSSMTVAGIAVLEICRQHLQDKSTAGLPERIARAWQWMEQHRDDIGDPATAHSLYFHYGLERAAILSDRTMVGDVDWYRVGARMLVNAQRADGQWEAQHTGETDTAFAVLFLRRKFQRIAGPITPRSGLLTRGLPDDASDEQIARAVQLDVARGLRAVPDLLRAMHAPVLAQRKAAALALVAIAGHDFGFLPYRDAEANADAIRAAEKWWLSEGRKRLREAGDR
jgi:hypothetical protein